MPISRTKQKIDFAQSAYGQFRLSVSQTTPLTNGSAIKIDTVVTNNNVQFNAGTFRWTVPAGTSMLFKANLRGIFSASTGYLNYQFYNVTGAAYIGVDALTYATNNATNDGMQNESSAMVTALVDTVVELRITDSTNLTSIFVSQSNVIVYQILATSPVVQDPFLCSSPQVALTVTGSSWTTIRAVGLVYKDPNGVWRLRFNIAGSKTAGTLTAYEITIAGIVFKNITTFYQQCIGHNAGGLSFYSTYTLPNTGVVRTEHPSTSTSLYCFSGDVELESRPSWL